MEGWIKTAIEWGIPPLFVLAVASLIKGFSVSAKTENVVAKITPRIEALEEDSHTHDSDVDHRITVLKEDTVSQINTIHRSIEHLEGTMNLLAQGLRDMRENNKEWIDHLSSQTTELRRKTDDLHGAILVQYQDILERLDKVAK